MSNNDRQADRNDRHADMKANAKLQGQILAVASKQSARAWVDSHPDWRELPTEAEIESIWEEVIKEKAKEGICKEEILRGMPVGVFVSVFLALMFEYRYQSFKAQSVFRAIEFISSMHGKAPTDAEFKQFVKDDIR